LQNTLCWKSKKTTSKNNAVCRKLARVSTTTVEA
jgi:hypothetical protein